MPATTSPWKISPPPSKDDPRFDDWLTKLYHLLGTLSYEEGTWVPAVTFATPGDLSVSYTVQKGFYAKVGQKVDAWFAITTSAFTFTTASGGLQLTGLPYPILSATGFNATAIAQWQGITKTGYTQVAVTGAAGASSVTFIASASGQALSSVVAADTPTGGTLVLRGMLNYRI